MCALSYLDILVEFCQKVTLLFARVSVVGLPSPLYTAAPLVSTTARVPC
jgi:hypothetical protein